MMAKRMKFDPPPLQPEPATGPASQTLAVICPHCGKHTLDSNGRFNPDRIDASMFCLTPAARAGLIYFHLADPSVTMPGIPCPACDLPLFMYGTGALHG